MITLNQATLIDAPIQRVFDLARSIEVHLAGSIPFEEQVATLNPGKFTPSSSGSGACNVNTGLLTLGDFVTWHARHLFVRQCLTSQITAYEPPFFFQDTMLRGAFHFMQHDHHFRRTRNLRTEMRDVFRFAAPFPLLGPLAEKFFLRRYMLSLLRQRNAILKQIAESPTEAWREYLRCVAEPVTQKQSLLSRNR